MKITSNGALIYSRIRMYVVATANRVSIDINNYIVVEDETFEMFYLISKRLSLIITSFINLCT